MQCLCFCQPFVSYLCFCNNCVHTIPNQNIPITTWEVSCANILIKLVVLGVGKVTQWSEFSWVLILSTVSSLNTEGEERIVKIWWEIWKLNSCGTRITTYLLSSSSSSCEKLILITMMSGGGATSLGSKTMEAEVCDAHYRPPTLYCTTIWSHGGNVHSSGGIPPFLPWYYHMFRSMRCILSSTV